MNKAGSYHSHPTSVQPEDDFRTTAPPATISRLHSRYPPSLPVLLKTFDRINKAFSSDARHTVSHWLDRHDPHSELQSSWEGDVWPISHSDRPHSNIPAYPKGHGKLLVDLFSSPQAPWFKRKVRSSIPAPGPKTCTKFAGSISSTAITGSM